MDIPAQHSRWLVIQLREVSGEAANLGSWQIPQQPSQTLLPCLLPACQADGCLLLAAAAHDCCAPLSQEQQLICIESFAYKPLRFFFLSLMSRLSLKSFPKQLALELRLESD